jgi:hypothetical protein
MNRLFTHSTNMDNEQPPYNAAQRDRPSTQRHRRGAHSVSLSNSTRLTLTQHLARKSQTPRPPASDPISTLLGNYHHAPLNARRVTADVHPLLPLAATSTRTPYISITHRHATTCKGHSHSPHLPRHMHQFSSTTTTSRCTIVKLIHYEQIRHLSLPT